MKEGIYYQKNATKNGLPTCSSSVALTSAPFASRISMTAQMSLWTPGLIY